eukprot:9548352-Alexandrium_andersonii.AAC.1
MDLGMLHLDPELRHEARVRELQKLDGFDVFKPVRQREREHAGKTLGFTWVDITKEGDCLLYTSDAADDM